MSTAGTAGEKLYEGEFSVVKADAEIQTGRQELIAVEVTAESPLPGAYEPLFLIKDGRAILVRDDSWPETGRIACLAPVQAEAA